MEIFRKVPWSYSQVASEGMEHHVMDTVANVCYIYCVVILSILEDGLHPSVNVDVSAVVRQEKDQYRGFRYFV